MLIGGFQPFTLSDFPGHVAAIVFTQGCTFRCPFCHNAGLLPTTAPLPHGPDREQVLRFLAGRSGRLSGLVLSGGEPTLQPDLAAFTRAARASALAIKLDTNGSRPDIIEALLAEGLVDYVAMDIKAPLEKYSLLCGVTVDTSEIVRSIGIIAGSGVPHHFRTTFYEAMLDQRDLENLQRLVPAGSRHVLQSCRPPPENSGAGPGCASSDRMVEIADEAMTLR